MDDITSKKVDKLNEISKAHIKDIAIKILKNQMTPEELDCSNNTCNLDCRVGSLFSEDKLGIIIDEAYKTLVRNQIIDELIDTLNGDLSKHYKEVKIERKGYKLSIMVDLPVNIQHINIYPSI